MREVVELTKLFKIWDYPRIRMLYHCDKIKCNKCKYEFYVGDIRNPAERTGCALSFRRRHKLLLLNYTVAIELTDKEYHKAQRVRRKCTMRCGECYYNLLKARFIITINKDPVSYIDSGQCCIFRVIYERAKRASKQGGNNSGKDK